MVGPFRRIVVLGHRGFIGRRIEAVLRAACPDTEVVGISSGEADLTQAGATAALAPLFGPETAVVVCAGIKKQSGDTLENFTRNMMIAVNLCRLLQERPVKRLVFLSTADVYGEERHDLRIREETAPAPTSYYGLAKFASEGVLRKSLAAAGGSSIVLRLPFVYGPGDREEIYGPLGFLAAALRGRPVTLWGDGSELREFLFVDDLAAATRRLLFHEAEGVLNLASGESHSFREIVEIIGRILAAPPAVTNRPRSRQKVDVGFDNRRLRDLLPGFSFTPLAAGLRRCLAELETARK